jgi:hypothetical protein
VGASEAASLVEGGQFAEVAGGRPSTLVRRQGWQRLLPARRDPHRLLGRIAPDVADRAELPAETPIFVGTSVCAAAHAAILAAGYDRAAVVEPDGRNATVTVPGASTVTAMRRLVVSADGRPLTRARVAGTAEAVDEELDATASAGPVLVLDDWEAAAELAAARAGRGQAVLRVEDSDLWAKGGALLAHWSRRARPVKLKVERLAAGDCARGEASA